jgi:hypothetical protein
VFGPHAFRIDHLVQHGNDGGKGHAYRDRRAFDFATDDERRVVLAPYRARESRLRPSEVLGQHLTDLVRLALGLLVADKDEIRLLTFDERLEPSRHQVTVEFFVGGVHAYGAVGSGAEHGAQHQLGRLRSERRDNHLTESLAGCLAVLGQAQSRLEGVLVVRARLRLQARRIDLAIRRYLDLVQILRVTDPFDCDENFHGVDL